MKTLKKLEILKCAKTNEIDILNQDALNLLKGGAECKKKYTTDSCGCGYLGPAYK